jgi:hypothetical protein
MLNFGETNARPGLEAKARCATHARHTTRKRRKSNASDAAERLPCPYYFSSSKPKKD